MKTDEKTGEITVIAHRGGAELFFENTITAFKKAQELGVDAIECDVHLTKDGQLVILHDPDLNRVAGINRLVSSMTLEEVLEVELQGGERIPTLEQALKEVTIPLVVELKHRNTIQELFRLLSLHPEYTKKVIVISFDHRPLLMLKEKFPEVITGALIVGFPVDPASVARSCKADMLSLYYEGTSKDYVDHCHNSGVKVSVWTPNSEKDIEDMIEAGVDAIASDRPDIVLRKLGRN